MINHKPHLMMQVLATHIARIKSLFRYIYRRDFMQVNVVRVPREHESSFCRYGADITPRLACSAGYSSPFPMQYRLHALVQSVYIRRGQLTRNNSWFPLSSPLICVGMRSACIAHAPRHFQDYVHSTVYSSGATKWTSTPNCRSRANDARPTAAIIVPA